MSDNIPFEIQVEIIKCVSDVKILLQFRSVSKPWKSLIDSSEFIADYHTRHRNHRLLARYFRSPVKILSIVDDDTFPLHKVPMTVPMYVELPTNRPHQSHPPAPQYVTTTTSQGLVCLYSSYQNTVLLWNPAIRKSVGIVVPNVIYNNMYTTVIGFGVSSHTNDPMLVKIICISWRNSDAISCIPRQVEVFKLSTGVWRSLCTNLPRKSIEFSGSNVVIDSFIYWIGIDWCDVDDNHRVRNMIMSFDMTSEEISMPDYLARFIFYCLGISKLGESLVVLENDNHAERLEYVVWIMEHGAPNSFRKLFTIKAPNASIGTVFGFRMTGEPIVRRYFRFGRIDSDRPPVTSVYDPCSQHFNDIVISEEAHVDAWSSYTETLLLLDH